MSECLLKWPGGRLRFFASGVSCPCLGPLTTPPVWQDEIQSLRHSSSCPPHVLSPSSQPLPTAALLRVLKLLCFCLSFPFLDGLPCPLRLRRYQSRAQVKHHLFCDTSSHPPQAQCFPSLDHLAPCSTLQGTLCPLIKSRTSQGLSLFQGVYRPGT